MSGWRRRILIPAVALVVAGMLAAIVWFAVPALAVGAGHKARVICSGVFVSRRPPADVLADLQVDDLAVLRYIDASIDSSARSVSSSESAP